MLKLAVQPGPYVQQFYETFLHSTILLIAFNALLMLFGFPVISTLFCYFILFTLLPFPPIIWPIAVLGITVVEVSA